MVEGYDGNSFLNFIFSIENFKVLDGSVREKNLQNGKLTRLQVFLKRNPVLARFSDFLGNVSISFIFRAYSVELSSKVPFNNNFS